MRKKLIICFFSLFLVFPLFSKAVAPIILGPGIELLLGAASSGVAGAQVATLATAASAGISATWTGVITALGAAVIYASFKDSAGNAVTVPVHTANTSPPAPSAPATQSQVEQFEPSMQSVYRRSTADAACQAWAFDVINASFGGDHVRFTAVLSGTTCEIYDNGAPGMGNIQIVSVIVCPAGYTISGGSCALSNARAAVSDNRCDITRSGETIVFFSGDVDCNVSGKIYGSVSGDTWTGAGVDQYGNAVVQSFQVLPNGQSQIRQRVQSLDQAGNSVITDKSVRLDSSGVPISSQQSQRLGQISVDGQAGTLSDSAAGSTSTSTTGSGTFPNDYAREATLQMAVDKLETLHDDLTQSATAPSDPVARTVPEISAVFFPSTFTALSAWQLPAHSSSCPTMVFDAFGSSFTIDAHCTLITNNASIVSTIMLLVWASMAMFVVLRA